MSLIVGTNTYINEADADTYFTYALHSAEWDAATTATKEKALVTATRMIDRQAWQGSRYADPQDLAFPRTDLVDLDGEEVDEITVPTAVLNATCELGMAMIASAAVQTVADTAEAWKRVEAGPVKAERFDNQQAGAASRFPTIIDELIGHWLAGQGAGCGAEAFGTCEETRLGSDDEYGLLGGWS